MHKAEGGPKSATRWWPESSVASCCYAVAAMRMRLPFCENQFYGRAFSNTSFCLRSVESRAEVLYCTPSLEGVKRMRRPSAFGHLEREIPTSVAWRRFLVGMPTCRKRRFSKRSGVVKHSAHHRIGADCFPFVRHRRLPVLLVARGWLNKVGSSL
ncbi:hypothetical protein TRVL_08124 [Trypanosoma vivax]|nr:hypothetical protein TRVL_08124 [Trypanosoma vivax]